jgi:ABC-type antimicrobial peptide transport system permease subunit
MAVGASRGKVAWEFLRRGATLAAIGATIGLGLAAATSRAISTLLYSVGPHDALAFGGGTALVMAIALGASFFPAWKASKTDPLSALRHQ